MSRAGTTAAVSFDVADASGAKPFVAVTTTRNGLPTSPEAGLYVAVFAPVPAHVNGATVPHCHWKLNAGAGTPFHVPGFAVIGVPARAVDGTVGAVAFVGGMPATGPTASDVAVPGGGTPLRAVT